MFNNTFWSKLNVSWAYFFYQQAETHIKRRMGIGSHISERRLIDDLSRMGLNESIVRNSRPHANYLFFLSLNRMLITGICWHKYACFR